MACSKCGNSSKSLGASSSCGTGCGCAPKAHTTPQPYYACAEACEEDHTKEILVPQFNTKIDINNSWNIPECGSTAILAISHLNQVLVGGYLWNPNYGYFRVEGFDRETGQLTVLNQCNSVNESPGTTVPACTGFIITPAPSDALSSQSTLFPYVAIDFTAPNEDSPLLITVTTVNGLAVGKNVQIGSGTYQIVSIPDADTIEIENNGAGIVPGTSVIAKNSAGEFQYPIILIDANQCTNPASSVGSLLVCKDGVTQPLSGMTIGSIPVLQDPDTNEVEYEVLELPTRTCSTILCCFTLSEGEDTYTINVFDSSEFEVGDNLQLGSRTDRYEVTAIPDGTHLTIQRDEEAEEVEDIPPGTSICLVGCCEQVGDQLQDILDEFGGELTPCSDFENVRINGLIEPDIVTGTLNSGTPMIGSESTDLVIENTSECRPMLVGLSSRHQIAGQTINANSSDLNVQLSALLSVDGGSYTTIGTFQEHVYNRTNAAKVWSMYKPILSHFVIPAGETRTYRFRTEIAWLGGGGSSVDISGLQCPGSYFGIAI